MCATVICCVHECEVSYVSQEQRAVAEEKRQADAQEQDTGTGRGDQADALGGPDGIAF